MLKMSTIGGKSSYVLWYSVQWPDVFYTYFMLLKKVTVNHVAPSACVAAEGRNVIIMRKRATHPL